MIRKQNLSLMTLALVAGVSMASAQTSLLRRDNFDDGILIAWTQGTLGQIEETNHQFVVSGTFGPTQTNNPTATHAAGIHSIPTSGPLLDNQTLEMRADLVGANQNDAWAGLHFLFGWPSQAQGYVFFKDEDEVALVKFWNGATSFAWFFYENRPLKNQNVTLVLALTRVGSDVKITTRVLDKDNANAVLFERTVTDTSQADPVLPNRAARGVIGMADLPGTPWPVVQAATDVELTLTWANSQAAPQPPAQVTYDNLEVWQYAWTAIPYVVVWGANSFLYRIPPSLTNAVAVAAGATHSLALRADGTVVAWGGYNAFGQTNIPPGLTNVVAIAAGGYDIFFDDVGHSLALRADGTVAAWGAGQTGTGSSYYHQGQAVVPLGLVNVVAVAAGGMHSLALRADGTVVAWGYNDDGQTNVPGGLSNVVAVAAGWWHSLALRADGTVVAWGANEQGQTNVPGGLSNVVAVAGGGYHSLALRADGTVVAWGAGLTNSSSFPDYGQSVVPVGLTNAVAIAAGGSPHSLALRADGTVVAWGNDEGLQTHALPGLTNAVAVSAGGNYSLALVGDGPPVVKASLSDPTVSANGFSVSVPTQSGRVYALEYKNSLTDVAWTPLPLVAGTGRERTLTDPTATGTQRFYRVRRW
jgi:hypothetical protein